MSAQQRMSRAYDRFMVESMVRRYYDNSGFFNFGYWTDETKTQRAACEALVDQLVGRLPNKSGTILDVACGLGASSKRLALTFPTEAITGVNISEAQIAQARERCPGSTFVVMDATDLRFPDDHFDNVICVEAAFHFDTRDQFLGEAFRVLKPGGTLVISDILFRYFWSTVAKIAHVPRENHVLDIAEYRARLATAGFVNIDVTDATAACLKPFCINLARWPMTEYGAGLMKLGRSLATWLGCRMLAAYFGFSCKTYVIASARKPRECRFLRI